MTIFDETEKRQVDLLHINRLSWTELRERVKSKYDYWHLRSLLAEKNSIGSVNIEELQKVGMAVIPFETTNESKASIMSALYIAIHTNGWRLQSHEVEQHEFRTFVSKQLPSGIWQLAAEGTNHDDTVISTALAKEAMNSWLAF